MADNFLIVNPEAGTKRTSGDAGSATILEPGKDGKSAPLGADGEGSWKPWAFTAGGGALAYLLAKYLLGDDDDEKNGKKKSWFKKILPYLAAAGGAFGGYAFSQPPHGKNGAKGEYAFRIGDDGKVSGPGPDDTPSDGSVEKKVGVGSAGAATLTGLRGWFKHRFNKILESERLEQAITANDAATKAHEARLASGQSLQRVQEKYDDLISRGFRRGNEQFDKTVAELSEARNANARAVQADWDADVALRRARSGLDDHVFDKGIRQYRLKGEEYLKELRDIANKRNAMGYSGARFANFLGRGGRVGRAGTWASFLAPLIAAPVSYGIGMARKSRFDEYMKAREMAGLK